MSILQATYTLFMVVCCLGALPHAALQPEEPPGEEIMKQASQLEAAIVKGKGDEMQDLERDEGGLSDNPLTLPLSDGTRETRPDTLEASLHDGETLRDMYLSDDQSTATGNFEIGVEQGFQSLPSAAREALQKAVLKSLQSATSTTDRTTDRISGRLERKDQPMAVSMDRAVEDATEKAEKVAETLGEQTSMGVDGAIDALADAGQQTLADAGQETGRAAEDAAEAAGKVSEEMPKMTGEDGIGVLNEIGETVVGAGKKAMEDANDAVVEAGNSAVEAGDTDVNRAADVGGTMLTNAKETMSMDDPNKPPTSSFNPFDPIGHGEPAPTVPRQATQLMGPPTFGNDLINGVSMRSVNRQRLFRRMQGEALLKARGGQLDALDIQKWRDAVRPYWQH